MEYWADPAAARQQLDSDLAVLKVNLCMPATLADGTVVQPWVSLAELLEQRPAFEQYMAQHTPAYRQAAEQRRAQRLQRVQEEEAAAAAAATGGSSRRRRQPKEQQPPNPTSQLWHRVLSSPTLKASLSAWVRVAMYERCTPPGSVENERDFSAMNNIKTKLRASLGDQHLDVCMCIAQSGCTFQDYPFARAFELWNSPSNPRRGTSL